MRSAGSDFKEAEARVLHADGHRQKIFPSGYGAGELEPRGEQNGCGLKEVAKILSD